MGKNAGNLGFWGKCYGFWLFPLPIFRPVFLAVSFLVGIFAHIFEERDRGAHLGELLLDLFFAQLSSSGRHSYREKPRNSLSLLVFPRPFSRAHNPEVMRFKSHPRNQKRTDTHWVSVLFSSWTDFVPFPTQPKAAEGMGFEPERRRWRKQRG